MILSLPLFILFGSKQILKLVLVSFNFHDPSFTFWVRVNERWVITEILVYFFHNTLAHLVNISCCLCGFNCWNHITFYKVFVDIWQVYMHYFSKLALSMICNSNCSNFSICIEFNPLVGLCEFFDFGKIPNLAHTNYISDIELAVLKHLCSINLLDCLCLP